MQYKGSTFKPRTRSKPRAHFDAGLHTNTPPPHTHTHTQNKYKQWQQSQSQRNPKKNPGEYKNNGSLTLEIKFKVALNMGNLPYPFKRQFVSLILLFIDITQVQFTYVTLVLTFIIYFFHFPKLSVQNSPQKL